MEGQAKSLAEIEFELQKDSKRRGSTGLVARGGSPAGAVGESDQTAFNNFLAIIRPNQPTEKRDFREVCVTCCQSVIRKMRRCFERL